MLTYRKKPRLRVRRFDAPEPPFFAATLIEPYAAAPTGGLVFDWGDLTARAGSAGEASVGADPRLPPFRPPVVIDGSPSVEKIFHAAAAHSGTVIRSLESSAADNDVLLFWPPDLRLLRTAKFRCLVIPVIYPATTDLELLRDVVEAARDAESVAAVAIELDPTGKRAVAESLSLSDDDERYEILFHENLETISIATERHIAAVAAEAGHGDHLPFGDERSNWNAASQLALAGARLVKMHEVELGLTLIRSARVVSQTEKPLALIAASASLSIIDALDGISAVALSEWLDTGDAELFRDVHSQWRLRRDYIPEEGDD
jgi:hypothetical protein